MVELARLLAPFVGLLLVAGGVALMFIYAPAQARDVVDAQYADFVRTVAITAGPAAAAALGLVVAAADRPVFPANAPPLLSKNAWRMYQLAAVAFCGLLGGAGASAAGVPSAVGYIIAALLGFAGTKIINVVINQLLDRAMAKLDKWLPPSKPGGAA